MKKKDIKRNRKNENLAGLYAVPRDFALEKNGKPKKGVYGIVDKNTPYVSKPGDSKKNKPRTFLKDSPSLPTACKNRILAFWDDKLNAKRSNCYLVEKSLYDEYKKSKK